MVEPSYTYLKDHAKGEFSRQSLRVGDIVKLERDEAAPADLLLLDSKGDNSVAYIETMALDGETNLKTKQPSSTLIGSCGTPEAIAAMQNAEIVVEDPNIDLYSFEGKIAMRGDLAPLTNNEIIYRGSVSYAIRKRLSYTSFPKLTFDAPGSPQYSQRLR